MIKLAKQNKYAKEFRPFPDEMAIIPGGVHDFASFRQWAYSDGFPERGRYDWIDNHLWIDISLEQAFWHNQPKVEVLCSLMSLNDIRETGYLFTSRVRISDPKCELSVEPDLFFVRFDSLDQGRVLEIPSKKDGGVIEFEGVPDMAIEIVSFCSEKKDSVVLRNAYHKAGVGEYWIFDVRQGRNRFDLLRHTPSGYKLKPATEAAQFSPLFQKHFRLEPETDQNGDPAYRLLYK